MNIPELIKSASTAKSRSVATRLQAGDIVNLNFNEGAAPKMFLVFRVNECRACLLPLSGSGTDWKNYGISANPNIEGIWPDTECTIVKRLGKSGMIEFLETKHSQKQRKENDSMSKKSTATEEAPKLGKLGGFLGHSLTSVIRAMGKAGWEYWEAVHVFESEKIPVAENTIRIQLAAGKRGQGGEPAPIGAELKKLRPDASEKPARKSAEKSSKKDKGDKKSSKKDKGDKKSSKKSRASVDEDVEPDEPGDEDAV